MSTYGLSIIDEPWRKKKRDVMIGVSTRPSSRFGALNAAHRPCTGGLQSVKHDSWVIFLYTISTSFFSGSISAWAVELLRAT
jgi:hypothetical protein